MWIRDLSLNQHFENFGFLYNLTKQAGENTDFQPHGLYEELQNMIPNLPHSIIELQDWFDWLLIWKKFTLSFTVC